LSSTEAGTPAESKATSAPSKIPNIGKLASSGSRSVMSHPRRLVARKPFSAENASEPVPLDLVAVVPARRDRPGPGEHGLRKWRRRCHQRGTYDT
jgi:hypothetical protein